MVSHAHTPTRTSLTSFASFSQGGLESHTSSVYCVSLVDDMAVTGGKDCNVRIWNLTEGRERVVSVLEGGHQGSVLTVCVLPLASSPSPSSSSSVNGDESDLGLPEMEPEGFRVLSGGSDGVFCVWEVRKTEAWGDVVWSSTLVKSVKAHTESLFGIKADLKRIVTCSKGADSHDLTLAGLHGLTLCHSDRALRPDQIDTSRHSTRLRWSPFSRSTLTRVPSTLSATTRART